MRPILCIASLLLAAAVEPLISSSAEIGAQAPLGFGRADPYVTAGRVTVAESLLYADVARLPREPAPRAALGRWLIARGAWRPGAILLEEARYFGADAVVIARDLLPAYERLGDWQAMSGMPNSPLAPQERRRAESLNARGTQWDLADSTLLAFAPSDSGNIGAIIAKIGDASVTLRVDPRVQGLVLDSTWRRRAGVETFSDASGRATLGIVSRITLGGLTIARQAVRIGNGGGTEGRIGLDVLGPFRPTFDAVQGRVTLRRPVPPRNARSYGISWPVVELPNGWAVVPPRDSLRPLSGAKIRALLDKRPWTFEQNRGVIVVP